jgi:hypothetical protein
MIYEGINFYPSAIAGRTIDEFIEAHKHQPLKKEQLKEVYELMAPKKQPQKEDIKQ